MNNEKAYQLILQKETVVLQNTCVVSRNEEMGMYQISAIDNPQDTTFTTSALNALVGAYTKPGFRFLLGLWECISCDFVKPEGDNQ